MELSSLRFPAITPHCSTSSSLPPISVRPTTTKSVAFLSSCRTKLYSIGVSRSSSKSLLSCRKRRNSIWKPTTFRRTVGVQRTGSHQGSPHQLQGVSKVASMASKGSRDPNDPTVDPPLIEGIVVVFAWMSSQEWQLKSFVELYSSLGWNSLVSHSQFLNMFFPEKATAIAMDILNELVEELKIKPCPVVFASLSGGPKACMLKVLQIIEGTCEAKLNLNDCRLVKDCIAGHIYDSSPVDFTCDLGAKFVLHPSVLKISKPPRFASWMVHSIASGLDALFLNRFESQRAEYWQTLYSTIGMQAPYLILCSENDDLAPYQVIYNFSQRLRELGADVKLVKWNDSPHVGHYRRYPIDYKVAVNELLGKAAGAYSQRIRGLEGETLGMQAIQDEIIDNEPMNSIRKAAGGSNGFRGVTLASSDHFFTTPFSMEYEGGRDVGSMQEERKEGIIHVHNPPTPSMNAHGVLGQILFDVCVPKTVEDWDIKPSSGSLNGNGSSLASRRRHAPFNPIKCIRRSRL